jgi:hypothetical protein
LYRYNNGGVDLLIEELDGEVLVACDYCGEVERVKISAYKRRSASLIKKDACKSCIGLKLSEAKYESFMQYVESIRTDEIIDGKFKRIPLGEGVYTVVDIKNYEVLINLCRWYFSASGYVVGNIKVDGVFSQIPMHRFIMGLPPQHFEVDHINNNRLFNVEDNLRICTRQENARNIRAYDKDKHSKYKGVTKNNDKWESRIKHKGRLYRIGLFTDEVAAANGYNFFAKLLFGEYANLNECPYMDESTWRSFITGKQLYKQNIRL